MASFIDELGDLLAEAENRNIVAADARHSLMALARERRGAERRAGGLTRGMTLLGAAVLLLGVSLLIAANWWSIPSWIKIGGFFLLFLGCHGAGILLRWRRPGSGGALAEICSCAGGCLFLAGLALAAQIFNLNARPSPALAAWFFSLLPLALLLRSTPLAGIAIAAGILWLHLFLVEMGVLARFEFQLVWLLEIGIGAVLVGLGTPAERLRESMGTLCRVLGGAILAVNLYSMGFFRYLANADRASGTLAGEPVTASLPADPRFWAGGITAAGLAACVFAYRRAGGGNGILNRLLPVLLAATLAAALVGFALLAGWIELGEAREVQGFGRYRQAVFHFYPMALTVAAWLLWFAWGIWLVFEGAFRENDGLISLGVYGVALGLATRFFDLIGTLADTGVSFVVGGLVLLACGWGAETWRRKLMKKRLHASD